MTIPLKVLIESSEAMRLALDTPGMSGPVWMRLLRAQSELSAHIEQITKQKVEVEA